MYPSSVFQEAFRKSQSDAEAEIIKRAQQSAYEQEVRIMKLLNAGAISTDEAKRMMEELRKLENFSIRPRVSGPISATISYTPGPNLTYDPALLEDMPVSQTYTTTGLEIPVSLGQLPTLIPSVGAGPRSGGWKFENVPQQPTYVENFDEVLFGEPLKAINDYFREMVEKISTGMAVKQIDFDKDTPEANRAREVATAKPIPALLPLNTKRKICL